MWRWLNGKKTTIGAGLSLLTLLAPVVGIPATIVSTAGTVANIIMGIGLAHKGVKAATGDTTKV